MNSNPLSQLLMEMNADSAEDHADSQLQSSHQFQCRCITDQHQAASICIEHFTISSDDERNLNNIAGKLSVFMPLIVAGSPSIAVVHLFVVCPVVISRKLRKIGPQLLWNTVRKLALLILLPHSDPSLDTPRGAGQSPPSQLVVG